MSVLNNKTASGILGGEGASTSELAVRADLGSHCHLGRKTDLGRTRSRTGK